MIRNHTREAEVISYNDSIAGFILIGGQVTEGVVGDLGGGTAKAFASYCNRIVGFVHPHDDVVEDSIPAVFSGPPDPGPSISDIAENVVVNAVPGPLDRDGAFAREARMAGRDVLFKNIMMDRGILGVLLKSIPLKTKLRKVLPYTWRVDTFPLLFLRYSFPHITLSHHDNWHSRYSG